jgi:ribonuclease P protein component
MRRDRLRGRKAFEAVFAHESVVAGRYFVVRARPNARAAARLGIIAARKAIRRAVDRNRCKRIVREAFRQHAAELAGRDIVVICRVPLTGPTGVAGRLELERLLPRFAAAGPVEAKSAAGDER